MGTRGTILVVDDDPDIAAAMRDMLVAEDYRVLVALSLAAARDILAAFCVGLIIVDAFHPGLCGDIWSPLQPLVAASRGRAIILCSAHDVTRYADFAAHGITAYLPKPFDLDDLLTLVAASLSADTHAIPESSARCPSVAREG